MRKVVPRPEVLLLTRKKNFVIETGRFQGRVQKRPLRICTSIIVVSPEPFSPTSSTSSATKVPENTEEDPNDFEPVDNGDIPKEYSSDQLYSQSISSVTNKITCQNLGQYRYRFIIQNI